MEAGKDLDGIGKVEPAVFKRGVTLRRIEGDPHDFLMYPQKCKRAIWGYRKDHPPCANARAGERDVFCAMKRPGARAAGDGRAWISFRSLRARPYLQVIRL
jgi:hypothetical protein